MHGARTPTVVVDTLYGSFQGFRDDLITTQLQHYSAHTRNELAMLQSVLRAGDNIIDIGAHIGTFSIPCARFNGGVGKVYAFEGNTQSFELLCANIARNHLESVVVPKLGVVSAKHQRFAMRTPSNTNSGMHYFIPSADDDADPALPSINIDEWAAECAMPPVSLVKVDVEGAELSVLRSCRKLVARDLPIVYVELNTDALRNFDCAPADIEAELRQYGYHFFRNIAERNSNNDRFVVARLPSFTAGGPFFDCLAVHPSSLRYPGRLRPLATYWKSVSTRRIQALRYRIMRWLPRIAG